MVRFLKIALVFITGLLLGLLMHGIIEILAIWILLNWLPDFFFSILWNTWIQIHFVFAITVEILGIVLVFRIYRKYER